MCSEMKANVQTPAPSLWGGADGRKTQTSASATDMMLKSEKYQLNIVTSDETQNKNAECFYRF